VTLLAGAAAAGMGYMAVQYYKTDDLDERRLLREAMRRGIDIDGERREDQAVRIINQLERAMNKKSQTHRHG
jgi:hypothetical protein